jgi:hypothetical protein
MKFPLAAALLAASAAAAAQTGYEARVAEENRQRAVSLCMHEQRADEMRSGRARYTCDEYGQKVLPQRSAGPSGNAQRVYNPSTNSWCWNYGGTLQCD